MKVLIVSHSCAIAANQALYRELHAITGWDITLVTPADWKDEFGNTLDEPPLPGLEGKVQKVPVLGNGSIILHVYRKRWKKFLQAEGFDVVYMCHEAYALATAHLLMANLEQARPAVFGFYSCQNLQKQYPFPFSWLERLVYEKSNFAFALSPEVAGVLRAKGYKGIAEVYPLPIDLDLCFPRGKAADEKLIPRAPGETVIGFVGRLVEVKGLRTLAQALGQLKDLSWKMVMVGTGTFTKEFKAILASHGLADRVTFCGYVPHEKAPTYLSAFDLMVLPSETQPNWKEQFGRVIPEAMACGTPVIGSNSGEIPNLIQASSGGLIFPEKNISALAQVLRTLILDPARREELASQGRSWVQANISIQGVARTLATTIETAVSVSRKP